ncbi:hypothetical protein [Flavobacterium sp. KACC 22763]|uniref:hypothetical protein n=1 Tax=Flavobacterium sp. KACC 22763 TaxID=3025668 RepID=UPI0023650512|nr:hypothetical protein [Flavobacterium sp. KACC 22763]WDF63689.1 hypothetical protein PQ463_18955 [Flavobacterium sp. KACC 22763]
MIRKVLFVLFLFLMSSEVYCCDCSEKPSIEENWELAHQVFIGKIIKVDSLLYGSYGQKVYVFSVKISKSYKGEIFPGYEYRDLLANGSGSCDNYFDIGEEYLIYSNRNNYALSSSMCCRTALLKNVDLEELAVLDKLNKVYLNDNEVKVSKLRNDLDYQIDLIKNSFQEKLKRKDLTIYILSLLSVILLVILLILFFKKKRSFKRNN